MQLDPRILGIPGWMKPNELVWVATAVANLPPESLVVELGAFCGRTTAAICQGAVVGNKQVITIDPFDDEAMRQLPEWKTDIPCMLDRFRLTMREFGFSPTVLQVTSLEAVLQVADQSVDLIFIDSLHTAVGEDIDAWRRKIKPGGIISGHDYGTHTWGVKEQVHARFSNVSIGPDSLWRGMDE